MIKILSQLGVQDCGQTTRRDFLRIGALGLGGLTLPSLLAHNARASSPKLIKDRSVIFLFLCGGASQIETFDPKMNAPEECRSSTGEVKTTLPGITFGGTFPRLGRLAHKMSVVRSYKPHEEADHARAIKKVFTVGKPMQASIGAISARARGTPMMPNGMPAFASLIEKEIDSQDMEDEERMTRSDTPGALGAAYSPFKPGFASGIESDMTLNVPLERLEDRRALLRGLDKLNRQADASGTMSALDQFEQRAVDMILGGKVRKALDLSSEDPRLLERYDTTKYLKGWVTRSPQTIGRQLLLARRLCEAGCGFVTVGMAGWDAHGNDKHAGIKQNVEIHGHPLDQAVSTLIEDIESRGLSDKILLVITSEFGRTPKIDKNGGGRDHWPSLCPLAFVGGGLKMGQVIGQSTPKAEEPATTPYDMDNMLATILHSMFDLGELRVQRGLPSELMSVVESARPIPELS